MSTRPLIIFAILTLLSTGAPAGRAMSPLTRQAVGAIETVDLQHNRLAIRGDVPGASPLNLSFDQQTVIWRNSHVVSAAALMHGQAVQVRYRLPFFGPAYASRIVLLSPAKPPNKTNNPNRKTKP